MKTDTRHQKNTSHIRCRYFDSSFFILRVFRHDAFTMLFRKNRLSSCLQHHCLSRCESRQNKQPQHHGEANNNHVNFTENEEGFGDEDKVG